ncbi:hypothetical protein HYFRA_00013744 [Hymenoscyphus fraxineus]|uniref:Fe2OG dioxygenase domain-containing protein n=1 Tax=Hymenoscyphus fraxineus TaxID=746836 RepID=A0A9N9L9J9_9HELO|nr:hypothetical protein HYFRA_00013744 [Hymenoscyphus fraxineus]
MDAFVSRSKRKRSLCPENNPTSSSSTKVATYETTSIRENNPTRSTKIPTCESTTPREDTSPNSPDDDSTEFKLALLSSLHPSHDQQLLLDVLLSNEGSVDLASASLSSPASPPPKKKSSATGYQTTRKKALIQRGKTLHLYSSEDIEKHTPCTIIHNFLPAQEANELLKELLVEASTFERMTFKLFENVVQSPHTACFYVEGLEREQEQKTEYIYNGGRLTDVRQLTPTMQKVSPKVQEAVNTSIKTRIQTHYPHAQKLHHQSPHPWKPNAAVVNCYSGAAESVGWHSDQFTYLGPRPVIGSISLGVAREFRVRRIIPQDEETHSTPKPSTVQNPRKPKDSDTSGQISIHLPHNSLLIMHADMQESWKHSIVPALTIDPHPIAGNKRINVTYRHYKASLHPRYTPRCKCGVPCVLRVVQRKKENCGRYFWMCYVGNVPGKEGCGFFVWAEFDGHGEPVWG